MSQINPKLEPGDRIVLLHMDDPYSAVKMGTKGTVTKIVKVPFGMGTQYSVKWDNGNELDLIPEVDSWVFVTDLKQKKKLTNEAFKDEFETLAKHKDTIKNIDYRTILDYLELVRKSGLVNMFQVKPFLQVDSKNLHKLIYRVGGEPEDYPELFEKIDEVREVLITETVRIMQEKNMEFDENKVNRVFDKVCQSMVELFMSMYGTYFKK